MFALASVQNRPALFDTETRAFALLPTSYRLLKTDSCGIVGATDEAGHQVELVWIDDWDPGAVRIRESDPLNDRPER